MATKEELKQQFIVLIKKAEKKYKEHLKIGQTPKICVDQNLKHLSPKESVEYIKQILILFHCDINKSISFFKSNYGYFNNIDRIFKLGSKLFRKTSKQEPTTTTKPTKSTKTNKTITTIPPSSSSLVQPPITLNSTTTTQSQLQIKSQIYEKKHNEIKSNIDTETTIATRLKVKKTIVSTTTQPPSTLTKLKKKLN